VDILPLTYLIEQMRKKMIDLGLVKGLSHQETIECSQLLDELLFQFQQEKAIEDNQLKIA